MSEWKACRCDRCGAIAACEPDHSLVAGWSIVRIQRRVLWLDTGHLDLCPDCTEHVYTEVREPTSPPQKRPAKEG